MTDYHHYTIHDIHFSQLELLDLAKSLIVIGAAFAIAQSGMSLFTLDFLQLLIISIATAGIGFLLHELAHKIVAQHAGCWSEFRANNSMLIVTMLLSFLGIVFAAPGAVIIHGLVRKKDYGRISAAGPFMNIILAAFFLLIALLATEGIMHTIGITGLAINSWLAVFNLLPFWQFDGLKVLSWSRKAYAALIIAAFGLMITASFI